MTHLAPTPILRGLVLASLCVLPLAAAEDLLGDAPPAADPAAPAATPAASDVDLRRLVADGKAAAARYSAAPTANAGAIIDAAVAFESARRLITGSTDQALVTDIQDNLFWCRKQMDLDALTVFRARMRNEVAKPAPLKLKAMASPPPPAVAARPAPAAPAPQAGPADEMRAQWIGRLRERMRASLAAGREPHFQSSFFQGEAAVTALAADNTLSLASPGGGMQMPWKLLDDRDLLGLALDLTHEDVPELHALAAWFLLLNGERTAAEIRLAKAGKAGAEVTAAFASKR